MEENCSKLINALLQVQEQIKVSISPSCRAASPNLDWVSVDVGCGQCESLQSSLQDQIRNLGELSGQIEFVTGILLQMHEVLRPAVDITTQIQAKQDDNRRSLPEPSTPSFKRPRSISDLPANLIATIMEFASHEEPSAVLRLSCVNRPFRRIALSNSHLWSRVNLTALQPDAVQLLLQRSGNCRLDISLTYLTDVSVDRELDVWKPLLGNHSQRVVSLTISAPGGLSLALASSAIRLWHLPSLRQVELQVAYGLSPSNPPKRLLLWDAFDINLNSIELSGNLGERLEETRSLLQQLEQPDGETANDPDRDSTMGVTDGQLPQDATADLLSSSMQRLEVTSTSQAALPDVDMADRTPRQKAKPLPVGTPDKITSVVSSTSTVVERSGSTCLKVTGFSQTTPLVSKSPCPAEVGYDAMETESTETQSVGALLVEPRLVSFDACGPPRRWEDLSSEDSDDPTMVGEYLSEIYDYLRKLEVTAMPDPDFMERQSEFTWKARGILADWMIKAHSSFHLLPETYWLAMNLLDRFLSRRTVTLAKAQLLGNSCLIIASKFTEIICPSTKQWAAASSNVSGVNDLYVAERYILKTLEYKISSPNPLDFLRRINRADDYDIQLRTAAKYLTLIQCFRDQLLSIPPSLLAASAYWLARIALLKFEWTESHIHYSGYREDQLVPHANLMVSYLLEPVEHPEFHRLWLTKKNLKAATFMREWVSKNWTRPQPDSEPEILPVDLSCDLIRLKERSKNEPSCSS